MKELDDYLSLQESIFKYFGYEEDWKILPIVDAREYYWFIVGSERDGSVRFHEDKSVLHDETEKNYYENEIYTQRFLNKWVYRGAEFTMICVDTHVDGNQYLQIFDNSKESANDRKEGNE